MSTWNRTGTVSRESLVVGEWTELYADVEGTILRIGSVKTGKLNVRRKILLHHGLRQFGTMPDRADTVSTRMVFEGRITELHRENLLFLLNRSPDEAKVPVDGDEPEGRIGVPNPPALAQYFTLYGRRPYATGDGGDLVFVMWKCRCADFVRISDMRENIRFKAIAHSDVDGDYGGSENEPYGWIYGYDAAEAPAPTPPIDMDLEWWEFDNTPPNDYIEAQGDYGNDFDPAGSFTVMMLVEEINQATNLQHGLAGKCVFGLGSPGGWDVSYYGDAHGTWPGGIVFSMGKANSLGSSLRLSGPGPMAVGRKVLIACTYTWVGDGNSIIRIVTHDAVNGKLFATVANGELINNTTIELRMGNCQRFVRPAGRVYWCGMYDGVAISDADILEVWNGTKHPIDDFNPTVLNYFAQAVAATYNGDVGNGANAPYTFDVISTPVAGP